MPASSPLPSFPILPPSAANWARPPSCPSRRRGSGPLPLLAVPASRVPALPPPPSHPPSRLRALLGLPLPAHGPGAAALWRTVRAAARRKSATITTVSRAGAGARVRSGGAPLMAARGGLCPGPAGSAEPLPRRTSPRPGSARPGPTAGGVSAASTCAPLPPLAVLSPAGRRAWGGGAGRRGWRSRAR